MALHRYANNIHATDNCNSTLGTNTCLPNTELELYWENWINVSWPPLSRYFIGEAGGHGLATTAAGQPTHPFWGCKRAGRLALLDLFGTVSPP